MVFVLLYLAYCAYNFFKVHPCYSVSCVRIFFLLRMNNIPLYAYITFLKRFHLFFREGKGVRKREGNINVWLPLTLPPEDLAHNPGMCPRLGIKLVTLCFPGQHSTTEPHQPGPYITFCLRFLQNLFLEKGDGRENKRERNIHRLLLTPPPTSGLTHNPGMWPDKNQTSDLSPCWSTSSPWSHTSQHYHTSFIHSSVDGHLGCFYLLAVVSKAHNMGVCSQPWNFWISW